jgi:hypothetical protein
MFNIQPDPLTFKETYNFNFKRVGPKSFTDLESLALRWAKLLVYPKFNEITDQEYIELAMDNNFEFYWDTLKVRLNYNSSRIPGLTILETAMRNYGSHHEYKFTDTGDLLEIHIENDSGIAGLILQKSSDFHLRKVAGFKINSANQNGSTVTLYNQCLKMSEDQVYPDPNLVFTTEKTSYFGFYKRNCIEQ